MFRLSEDSNNSNNTTHAIRRSLGTRSPQVAMNNAAAVEELCIRDDQYFNLLYKTYDSNSFGLRSRTRSVDDSDIPSTSSNSVHWPRNDMDKARSSRLDYRQIDEELMRIQQDCETMENNLARVGLGPDIQKFLDDKREITKPPENSNNTRSRNRMATILNTCVRSASPDRDFPTNIGLRLNGAPITSPVLSVSIRRHQSSTHNEIAARPEPLPMIGGLITDRTEEELATPPVANQIKKSLDERKPVEQSSQTKKNDLIAAVSSSESYKCPVCLNCVRQRKPAATLCGHVFCHSCIKAALRITCKCPVCQKLMTSRQVFRIYI